MSTNQALLPEAIAIFTEFAETGGHKEYLGHLDSRLDPYLEALLEAAKKQLGSSLIPEGSDLEPAQPKPADTLAADDLSYEIEMTQKRWDSLMAMGMKPVVAVTKIMKKYREHLEQQTSARLKEMTASVEHWKKGYYDVADAACAESSSTDDVCRHVRDVRQERDSLRTKIKDAEAKLAECEARIPKLTKIMYHDWEGKLAAANLAAEQAVAKGYHKAKDEARARYFEDGLQSFTKWLDEPARPMSQSGEGK